MIAAQSIESSINSGIQGSPAEEEMFAPESYTSIDLSRRPIKVEEEKCQWISSVIQTKSDSEVKTAQEEEKEEKLEEWTPEQKAIFAPSSYSSINLTRKLPNQEEKCQWITSEIRPVSESIKEEDQEEWTPEQKAIFAPQSYASIDLSRKDRKVEEDNWITYLDRSESPDSEDVEEEEELSEEQKILFAPSSYASVDLTKRNPLDSSRFISGFPEVTAPKSGVQEAPKEPESENNAEKSETPAPKSPDVQPPAKIPRKRKIDTTFVMAPVKKIEGDTPQRPFPKELYWYNPKVSGTATEIFDMVFKKSSQSMPKNTTANFAAPATALQIMEQARQKTLQNYKGTPLPQKKIQKQKNILQSVQNTLWLVNSYKKDPVLEQALRSTLQKFSAIRGDDGRLRIMDKKNLSIVWNLTQRESDWQLRPVYIDGLSILDMVSGSGSTGIPMLQVQILIELLLHFILDGHQVTLFLPEVYKTCSEKVDDSEIFEFLCTMDIIKFSNKKSRKAVEAEVLMEAEKTGGIICSNSDDLDTTLSIQCIPVLQKISTTGNYTVNTMFARKASDSDEESNLEYSEKCRLYSNGTAHQIDTPTYQLSLQRQAFLISSLIHVTTFSGQRKQQIEVFLMMISRFLPEILPKIMQKSMITTVGEAIGMVQAEEKLVCWPIFLK